MTAWWAEWLPLPKNTIRPGRNAIVSFVSSLIYGHCQKWIRMTNATEWVLGTARINRALVCLWLTYVQKPRKDSIWIIVTIWWKADSAAIKQDRKWEWGSAVGASGVPCFIQIPLCPFEMYHFRIQWSITSINVFSAVHFIKGMLFCFA